MLRGVTFAALIMLAMYGLIVSFFPDQLITVVVSSCTCILINIILIYDMNTMMDGMHRSSFYIISPEEYVYVVLTLYTRFFVFIIMFILYVAYNYVKEKLKF